MESHHHMNHKHDVKLNKIVKFMCGVSHSLITLFLSTTVMQVEGAPLLLFKSNLTE